MEGLPMVSYLTGTMNSLVDKLDEMKNHSDSTKEFSALTQQFKKAVPSLKEDFFDKHGVPEVCVKQVRELFFEIEDWIDRKPKSNMLDPWDEGEIKNFMADIKEARERFTWYYDLLKVVPTEPDVAGVATSNININPRLLVEEKLCHGLLDGPRDELIKHLTNDKDEMRKVVSVVGMEGLGKTTLAKEIYSELQLRRMFEHQAFVSVGRRPAMREILREILRQVKPFHLFAADVGEIITELQECLDTKRYFILIDGIWSTWAWKLINCALPNNRGSRVMTTTCIMDVGRSCCSYPNDLVYQMEAPSQKNSQILFLSKIVTLEEEEKGASFAKNYGNMLNDFSGMPLAIIVAAGLLASRELGELKMLWESIYSPLKQYSPSEWMTKILQMSFADLPLSLRSCFLYLSVFPENYTIKKDRLIRLWGAEGFISRTDEECLWVIGERYFHELISRRLIQPVFTCDDDQAVGCTVHTVILDFIISMSREENFATRATELNSGPFPCGTIRRYSLDCGNKDEAVTLSTSIAHLSSVRSLTVFGDVEGKLDPPDSPADDEKISDPQCLPSVSKHGEVVHATQALGACINILLHFKLLRVLDLEDTKNLENHHLKGIGGLVLLRYLGLGGTGITQLPEDIGELEQLETLDWRRHVYLGFPASIGKLQKLRHLLLPGYGMENWEMPRLEEASDIHVKRSSSLGMVVELLMKSGRLRTLDLTLEASMLTKTDLVSFLDKVVKSKLQFLSLHCNCYSSEAIPLLVDSWQKVTAPLETRFEPRRFELTISYPSGSLVLPNMGSLASLTHLQITVYNAKAQHFLVLEGLTNLALLQFHAHDCYEPGRIIIKGGIFPFLKVFWFRIENRWMGLEFEKGAMPQLQRLGRGFHVSTRMGHVYPDIGIEHLPCLTRIHAIIDCGSATVSETEAAEAAIRAGVFEIATKPTFELERIGLIKEDERGQHVRRRVSEARKKITRYLK